MTGNCFIDKNDRPDEKKLSEVLGPSYKLWQAIKNSLTEAYEGLVEEWKYYGQNYGWSMKFYQKRRNLFFMSCHGRMFRIAFIFGDKAMGVVQKSDLPEDLKDELKNAKKYAEGRGLRIEVKTKSDVENVLKLVQIKVNN